ncbi:sigma-E processing peptidase SpoIIGA [Caldicellulosiruptoraceae bacterium PP1]
MVLYADIFILENIVMNYFILTITSFISKINISSFRVLFFSIIFSFYSLLQFSPSYSFMYSFIGKIIISIIIIYLTYIPKNIIQFIKLFIAFYLVTILFGGTTFFIYYWIYSSNLTEISVKLKNIFIALSISLIIFKLFYDFLMKRYVKESLMRFIRFKINDKFYECIAFVDTGNSLKEPLTGKPVVILEGSILNLNNLLKQNMSVSQEIIDKLKQLIGTKILLIPYNSIGQEHGVLYGVIPEEFYISEDKKNWIKKEVIIGLYWEKLSNKYSALLGIDIL